MSRDKQNAKYNVLAQNCWNAKQQKFICNYDDCNRSTRIKGDMVKHLRFTHESDYEQCIYCERWLSNISRHMRNCKKGPLENPKGPGMAKSTRSQTRLTEFSQNDMDVDEIEDCTEEKASQPLLPLSTPRIFTNTQVNAAQSANPLLPQETITHSTKSRRNKLKLQSTYEEKQVISHGASQC